MTEGSPEQHQRGRSSLYRIALTCLALGMACDSDSTREIGFAAPGTGPTYLAVARIWDDTTTTSYLHAIPSLSAGTLVDPALARELPGAAKLFAQRDLGWFAIGGGEAPTITRYTLGADGQLEPGRSISLQPFGVDDLWDSLYFVSADKAYYPDTTNSQLVIWNPTSMEVTGTLDLGETARDDYLSYYGLTPILRGNKLIFSVGWFDWETNDSVMDETGLVVIDTDTDTLSRFDIDRRCAGITQAIEVASGDTYFVSSALAGAAYRLGRLASAPCALRVRANADAFDPDYRVDLGDLTGGNIAGEPMPGGAGLVLREFDESLATVESDALTWDLTGQAAWRWLRWDVSNNRVSTMDDLEPSTSDVFWFTVDDQVFASETTPDYSQTTLIQLPQNGAPSRALTVPGFLQGIARIR
jgi:hypothetical protein